MAKFKHCLDLLHIGVGWGTKPTRVMMARYVACSTIGRLLRWSFKVEIVGIFGEAFVGWRGTGKPSGNLPRLAQSFELHASPFKCSLKPKRRKAEMATSLVVSPLCFCRVAWCFLSPRSCFSFFHLLCPLAFLSAISRLRTNSSACNYSLLDLYASIILCFTIVLSSRFGFSL